MQFDEPTWISLEPRNHLVFDKLLSFISSASSNHANLQQLAHSTTAALSTMGTKNPSVDQYRFESRVLFAVLFTIVMQLDAAAAQQDHLIKLVVSLRRVPLPATVAQEIDPRAMDHNMNEELKKLINVLSSFEKDAPLYPRLEDRPGPIASPQYSPWRRRSAFPLTAGEWASINAFVARLHVAAPDVIHLDLWGLFAMIEALEQPLTPRELENVLPAAACWIVYAGKELQSNDVPYAYYDDDGGSKRLPWSKGPLWNGQHAFNQARWEF